MVSDTFGGEFDWVVPDDNASVVITCHGGRGQNGNTDGSDIQSIDQASSAGANGGVVQGELNVNPGDVLHLRHISGGQGNHASWDGNSGTARGGDGGDGAAVYYGSVDKSDAVIVAGGGGGGGAAVADEWEDWDTDAAAGGGGGAGGEDGGDASTGWTDAPGGTGGGRSSMTGGDGGGSTSGHSSVGSAGAGGGGGGGYNGGGGGAGAALTQHNETWGTNEDASGGGGGGGDGYTGGVYNTSSSVAQNSSGAFIIIDYTPTPNPPQSTNRIVNHQGPSIEVVWNIHDSITDGFYVYRSTTPGFTPSTSNRIATINNGSATSYTDSTVVRGTQYYYKVSAFESTSGNESDPSVQTSGTAGEVFKISDGAGTHTQYPVKYFDGSAFQFATNLWVYTSSSGYSETAYSDTEYGGTGSTWRQL